MTQISLLKQLLTLYQKLLKIMLNKMTPSEQLANLAKSKLGTDFTNDNVVSDEYSCAFAVSTILHEQDIEVPIVAGTYDLWRYMQTHMDRFDRILEPVAGCIVISPTGTSSTPEKMPNGHTGIYIDTDKICSNSSANGLWSQNYTRESWRERYYYQGNYPIFLFKKTI